MALRIRFQYAGGTSLGYSIEQLSTGLFYDFSISGATAGSFTAAPVTPINSLPADSGNFAGRYKGNLTSTPPAVFVDGDYCVTIHNISAGNLVIAQLASVMHNGDDATVIPGASGSDPWATALPGTYSPGTAGYTLGTNLDAHISTRLPTATYVAPPTDYQQRTQPVILPTTAPAWSSSDSTPPTVSQIVAGIWDEPKAGHIVAGSFGTLLDAAVSSRLASSTDTPGTSTLLNLLTVSRAAYLDNLNVGGMVASHADVAAVGNNTLVRIFVPDLVQKPASSSTSRIINLYTYDETGNMATPDTSPTISVADGAGLSRNANLNATTMTPIGPGHYQSVYTITSTDPIEQLLWSFTVVQNGQVRQYGGTTEVVDVASVDFNTTDRANLNALVGMVGTTGVVIAAGSKGGFTLAPSEHLAITTDTVAALNSMIPASPTSGSLFDRLDVKVSSRSIYAGGPVAGVLAPVVVGQNNDKVGYALSSSGLDTIQIETGINARQAFSPILAATAGVVSGAETGTITIRGGNVTTTRIMAATDSLGNRSAVILTLPN